MEVQGSERFGHHLRRLRERRRLSLDKVEELSTDHLERITRSHLSRIENGQALPTLPRLMTLSRLYGEKLADLVERLEFDIQFEGGTEIDVTDRSIGQLEAEAKIEAERGDLTRAFRLLEAAGDKLALSVDEAPDATETRLRIELKLSTTLLRAGKLSLAAEYAQLALSDPGVPVRLKLWGLMNLATVNRRLGRNVLCRILVETVLSHGEQVPTYHQASAQLLLGGLAIVENQLDEAVRSYTDALRLFRELERPFEQSRALKGIARCLYEKGQLRNGMRFADTWLELARRHELHSEEGWALQLRALIAAKLDDVPSARALLRQSNEIARRLGHVDILFTNHFHQWRLASKQGDEARATSIRRVLTKLRGTVEEDLDETRAFDAECGEGRS